jgi:predicted enzyme involved in methoxymalonyl-ACP biosynthesis
LFFQMDPAEAMERARMESEAAAMQVQTFIDGMDAEQLKAFSLVMRAAINAGQGNNTVAAFHWGQAVQRLRGEFGMCTCDEDHLKEEHEKLQVERETAAGDEQPTNIDELVQQSKLMDEYCVAAVPGTKLKVRCTGSFGDGASCDMTWESLDERMLANRCGKCEAGPTGH